MRYNPIYVNLKHKLRQLLEIHLNSYLVSNNSCFCLKKKLDIYKNCCKCRCKHARISCLVKFPPLLSKCLVKLALKKSLLHCKTLLKILLEISNESFESFYVLLFLQCEQKQHHTFMQNSVFAFSWLLV